MLGYVIDFIGNVWTGVIFIILIALSRGVWHRMKPHNKFSFSSNPNLYLSLGILFTFIGVFAGLYHFNSSDIQASIPQLLNGLKTSFLSSIVGISLSLLCLIVSVFHHKQEVTPEKGVSTDDIYALMKQSAQENNELLEKLIHSIASDDDASLSSHMAKLRNKFDDLQSEFKKFAENVGEASTDKIVEALQDVVTNFNEKITSQFGEHFKALNSAVEKLVIWQEQYKSYLDQHDKRMIQQNADITQFSHDLSQVSQTTDLLNEKIEQISLNMQSVNNTIHAFEEHSNSLHSTLEEFSKLSTNAQEAFPIIDAKLKDITDKIANSMTVFMKSLASQMTIVRDKNLEIVNTFSKTNNDLTNSSQQLSVTIESVTKTQQESMARSFDMLNQSMGKSLEEVFEKFDNQFASIATQITTVKDKNLAIANTFSQTNDDLENSGKQLSESISSITKTQQESMEQSFNSFNNAMEKSLQEVFNHFDSQFASITEKVANDYGDVMDKVSKIVAQATGGRR